MLLCVFVYKQRDLFDSQGMSAHNDHGVFLLDIILRRELTHLFLLPIYFLLNIKSPLHFKNAGNNSDR